MTYTSEVRERKRPVPGRGLARALHWPLLVAWQLAAVAQYPVTHSLGSVANNTAAANLPSAAPSTRVPVLEQAADRGQPETDAATVLAAGVGRPRGWDG